MTRVGCRLFFPLAFTLGLAVFSGLVACAKKSSANGDADTLAEGQEYLKSLSVEVVPAPGKVSKGTIVVISTKDENATAALWLRSEKDGVGKDGFELPDITRDQQDCPSTVKKRPGLACLKVDANLIRYYLLSASTDAGTVTSDPVELNYTVE